MNPIPKSTWLFFGAFLSAAALVRAQDNAFPKEGIAAQYPNDIGIDRDPRVVFSENFEEDSIENLGKRWEDTNGIKAMVFSDEKPAGSSGKHSLIMERKEGSGCQLYRRLANQTGGWGYPRIFARYYVKFDRDCQEIHHFGTCLGGNEPATRWPMVKAGYPTDGAKSFWSGIEPFGNSWTWDFYTYWCDMKGSPPEGQTWGNSFIRNPELRVEKDRWICVEHMIKLNDPGESNGEQALWIDGKLISHLGKGFPLGLWQFDKFLPGVGGTGVRWNAGKKDRENFTVPDGGAPFEGFRWRTTGELNINFIWLYIYSEKPPGHFIKVWFDDVVVATDYIGPLRSP